MLQIMLILFIVVGIYSGYKADCSSHHAENTFLYMRQNPRGPTFSTTGMDDRFRDEKGETNMDLVKFFEVTNILKRLPRTGWLIKGIKNPESIAAHSFSTTLLALIMGIDRKDINLEELLIMSIVHDLGESYLGDLTPSSINLLGGKEHKDQLEKKAIMQLFMLLDENRRDKLLEVYEAYSNNETDEAKLLHQIDKLDMLFQAIEYQKAGYPKEHLQEFWDAAESSIIDEKLIEIIRHLKERYR